LHLNEKPWIGPAWRDFAYWDNIPPPAPQDCQKCAVETGALYKYVRQNKIYTCPNGRKGELVTYSIMDGMNGMWMYRYNVPANGPVVRALCYKNMGQIKKASTRAVFIDEGSTGSDSYGCAYDTTVWTDFPPVRHGNGMTISYADGHAEWWKWKGKQTITYGKMHDAKPNPSVGGACRGYNPLTGKDTCGNNFGVSCDAFNDLYKMQVSCWGSVGYTNPMPGCQLSSD
jgi:prepilin-type processing-associated H-X9-DG protein